MSRFSKIYIPELKKEDQERILEYMFNVGVASRIIDFACEAAK